ncbi:MAG: hypothetical protein PT977_04720 [Acidobacteriota bacterium]|nr:hypothetical protein [Acidobacteriota bacterium]
MRFPANVRALTLVGCAALIPAISAPAQVSLQFHFGEDEYHRIDSRHPLQGRQYQTMGSLAHTLDEIAQDLNREAYRTSRGDRSQMRLLASISDFSRRTSGFHLRMDSYLDSPWDMRSEVDDLTKRARGVNQNVLRARLFPQTYALWTSAIDVLGRMQQVLRGVDVELPPPYARFGGGEHGGHGDWDHRDNDRNGNGVPDRLEVPPPPPDRAYDRERAGSRAANIPELRRLGKELDERVAGMRDAMPRGDRDARSPESLDRFGADAGRLRQRFDADVVDTRGVQDVVSRMLDDARRKSNELRTERAYRGEQEAWQRVIEILTRMQSLL